jgi:hypothetical protein
MDPYLYMTRRATTERQPNKKEEEEEKGKEMTTPPNLPRPLLRHSTSTTAGHPLNTWYEFRAEQGRPFYHNPVTKTSIWTHPLELFRRERAVRLKKIPRTSWKLAYCRDGRTFFYHPINRIRTWKLPEELQGHEISSGELEKYDDHHEEENGNDEERKNDDDNVQEMTTGSQEDDIDEHQIHDANNRKMMESEGRPEMSFIGGDSLRDRSKEFQNMLEELKINPFSSWDIEEPKLSKDPRFECNEEIVFFVLRGTPFGVHHG